MALPEARVVLVTHPADGAADFAGALVERRLAACVNLVEAISVYRWKGAIEREAETLLIVKTSGDRVAEIERVLRDEHPYDVPECVVLDPTYVEHAYLAWLLGETGAG